MDVILKQDVDRLGAKNDVVNVKNGFARNYLIPQGFAIAATESARKVLAETVRQQSHKALKALEDAKALGEKIAGLSLKIGAKAGESGKIFGSVNNIQVAEAMGECGTPARPQGDRPWNRGHSRPRQLHRQGEVAQRSDRGGDL